MITATTKNFISYDNKLFKSRVKDGVKQIKKNVKWITLEVRGKYIKTKTLCCTNVNHIPGVREDFKEGKRYQVLIHSGIGHNAGYIYDEDGDGWKLYRSEDVGFFTPCGTYKFKA